MLLGQHTLKVLLKAGISFFLYGPQASGKTTLLNKLLAETNTNYIVINCCLTEKKSSFLKLFNTELSYYLKLDYQMPQSSSIDNWINEMENLVTMDETIKQKLNNLYIFFDNVEQLQLNQKFLSTFYTVCRKYLPFKFSFIFCGITYGLRTYTQYQPFKSIISFCMPKPKRLLLEVIELTVRNVLESNKSSQTNKQEKYQQKVKILSKNIFAGFQLVQTNLKKIIRYTRIVVQSLIPLLASKKSIALVQAGQISKRTNRILEYQSLVDHQIQDKIQQNDRIDNLWKKRPFYMNIILASIYVADDYAQSDDKRRFKDYKKQNGRKGKLLKKICSGALSKHNIQRIIAIGQSLESQTIPTKRGKQAGYKHHTLDYYVCFQNLSEQNLLLFIGNKNSTWGFGKIQGKPKEEQVKSFFNQLQLKMNQYI